MRHPFSLMIWAHINVSVPAPGRLVSVPVEVVNTGSRRLRIAASVQGAPASWHAHLAQVLFTLRPGRHVFDVLRVAVPRSARGMTTLHCIFSAAPLARHAAIRISGAVGDSIVFRLPPAAVPHHPGGGPWPLAVLGGLVMFMAALAAFGAWRRRRLTRQAEQPAQQPARERGAFEPLRPRR